MPFCQAPTQPLKWFKTGPEIIRLAVMMYVRFPLSLRNIEDLLHERGVEISHESVRLWWHRFRPMFAAEIRKWRIEGMKSSLWGWHLDEMLVKIDASGTTSGASSITRARYWKASSRRLERRRRR